MQSSESMSNKMTVDKVRESLERNDGHYIKFWNAIIEDFYFLLPNNPRVLDLGCGFGVQSSILNALGADVEGVDIDEDALLIAREMTPQSTFHKMDMRELSTDLGKFDCIFSSMATQYLNAEELPVLYRCWNKFIKKDGYLVLLTNRKNFDKQDYIHLVEPQGYLYIRDGYINQEQQEKGWINCIFKRL